MIKLFLFVGKQIESAAATESSIVSVPEPVEEKPVELEVTEVPAVVELNSLIPEPSPATNSPASESIQLESAPLPDPIDTPVVSESSEISQLPPPPEDLSLEPIAKEPVVVNGISPVDEIPPPPCEGLWFEMSQGGMNMGSNMGPT